MHARPSHQKRRRHVSVDRTFALTCMADGNDLILMLLLHPKAICQARAFGTSLCIKLLKVHSPLLQPQSQLYLVSRHPVQGFKPKARDLPIHEPCGGGLLLGLRVLHRGSLANEGARLSGLVLLLLVLLAGSSVGG